MNPLRSFCLGPLRAHAFTSLEAGLEPRALAWFEQGPGPMDVSLKSDRVWRSGPYAIKRFPRRLSVALGLRRSSARLNADQHERLRPVRTPAPYLVLESRNGESLLVSEYIDGDSLGTLWNEGGPGVLAFPHFLALMHRRKVFHGDFHLYNALWNGQDWVLLDLEGLRHPLRRMHERPLILRDWARLHLYLRGPRGMQAAFATYVKAAGLGWQVARDWARIVALSKAMALQRGIDPGYIERDGLDPAPQTTDLPLDVAS